MSLARHIVQRPRRTGCGKRPLATPAHQVLAEIGSSPGLFLPPTICRSLRNPFSLDKVFSVITVSKWMDAMTLATGNPKG